MPLYDDAMQIVNNALFAAKPDEAVKKALENINLKDKNRVLLISIGKAAWHMANAAKSVLGKRIDGGVVITKYKHSVGDIPPLKIYEAGHPVPDENTILATDAALSAVENLCENDAVLFLVSGGGSALFEKPKVSLDELKDITTQLLKKGCDIVETNTIRKRLSYVKGGQFALRCEPAHVYAIVLSDILGDPLDMIASGPAYPDSATSDDAKAIIKKYSLELSPQALELMKIETPKELKNVTTQITGSVSQLCASAKKTANKLGYKPIILTDTLRCEAREAGSFIASIAEHYQDTEKSLAFIMGGETIVRVKGSGKGGRNQEIALAASKVLSTCKKTCVFSVGSDGTDGPTDAAGGYVDNKSLKKFNKAGVSVDEYLLNNDAYNALEKIGGLIITGPTGTNVNDLTVLLIKR